MSWGYANLPCYCNGERLACLGGMIYYAILDCYCNCERSACLGGMLISPVIVMGIYNANLPCYCNGERLACIGGMIFVRLTFSLVIIQDSFSGIRNNGSIHINAEVFRNILYSYLQ